jgi:hypothetical protein
MSKSRPLKPLLRQRLNSPQRKRHILAIHLIGFFAQLRQKPDKNPGVLQARR